MKEMTKPKWIKMKEPELKKTILELSQTYAPSQIGIILRDQYGIPTTKVFGKKLKEYLKELGIDSVQDVLTNRQISLGWTYTRWGSE